MGGLPGALMFAAALFAGNRAPDLKRRWRPGIVDTASQYGIPLPYGGGCSVFQCHAPDAWPSTTRVTA
jgi:hypothetical protein